jgi:hypothetical protein
MPRKKNARDILIELHKHSVKAHRELWELERKDGFDDFGPKGSLIIGKMLRVLERRNLDFLDLVEQIPAPERPANGRNSKTCLTNQR